MATITILTTTIPDWQGPTNVELRIYSSQAWMGASGLQHLMGSPYDLRFVNNVFKKAPCTLSGTTLTIPEIVVESTADAQVNSATSLMVVLCDADRSGRWICDFGTLSVMQIPASPTSISWAQLAAFNAGVPATPPAQPIGPTATLVDANNVDVLITASSGAISYRLQRSVNGAAFADLAGATGLPAGTYHDPSAAPLTSYAYRAIATNIFGDSPTSGAGNTVTTPQVATPPTPVLNALILSGLDVELTTTATPRVTSYQIWRGTTSGSETLLATVVVASGAALDYHDTTVAGGTAYFYKVKALNAGGTSAFSNEQSGTVTAAPIDPATISGRILDLDGDSNAGAGGSAIATWTDASSSANNATQAVGGKQPTVVASAANGHKAVRFDGSDDVLALASQITTARTIFVVAKHATGSQDFAPILGSATTFDFAGPALNTLIDATNASASIRGGHVYVNGYEDSIGVTNLVKPTSYQVVSFATTGSVAFGNISSDRNTGGRFWNGDYVRIIAFDVLLSDATRQGIETFLKSRYSLTATKVLRQQIISVGDSQSASSGWQVRVVNCLAGNCAVGTTTGPWFNTTHATGGYTLADMATYDSTVASDFNVNRIKQAVIIWASGNDMYNGATGATAYSRLLDRVNAYKAAGYTNIIVPSALHRVGGAVPAGYNTECDDFNSRVVAGAAANGYVYSNIIGVTELQDPSNLTYFSDGTHLTASGFDKMAPVVAATVTALP